MRCDVYTILLCYPSQTNKCGWNTLKVNQHQVHSKAKNRCKPFGIKSGVMVNLLYTTFKTQKYNGCNYYQNVYKS